MPDKPLAEMTQREFEQSLKITRVGGVALTVAIVVAVGSLMFGALEEVSGRPAWLTIIFLSFILISVISLAMMLGMQHLQLRKDLWDVLQAVKRD